MASAPVRPAPRPFWGVKSYTYLFVSYVCSVALLAYLWGWYQERQLINAVDERLHQAAVALKLMLAPDFHDRAVDATSISLEEELRNREALNHFAAEAGLVYVYTLAEKDGEFFFAAPTVTPEEAQERERWYFYPYEDIPTAFLRAWKTRTPQYATYSDQWGTFRSVAVAERGPGGRPYLACADMDISAINQARLVQYAAVVGASLLLVGLCIPLLVIFRRTHTAHADYLAELNSRLAEKARQLELANCRLVEIGEVKSTMMNSVSHELRTPLTSIVGYVKLTDRTVARFFEPLVQDNPELLKHVERIHENLRIVSQESERLTRLVNDFLDLAKIESGNMDWHNELLDPRTVLGTALDAVRGELEGRQDLELQVDVDPQAPLFRADPDRIQQLLVNLLHNALKFTPKGRIVLGARAVEQGLELSVSDTGVGIAPHDQAVLFEKFQCLRAGDTVVDKRKGTGLGLAICKQIVEHYGGRISLESAPGQGSTFKVLLPELPL